MRISRITFALTGRGFRGSLAGSRDADLADHFRGHGTPTSRITCGATRRRPRGSLAGPRDADLADHLRGHATSTSRITCGATRRRFRGSLRGHGAPISRITCGATGRRSRGSLAGPRDADLADHLRSHATPISRIRNEVSASFWPTTLVTVATRSSSVPRPARVAIRFRESASRRPKLDSRDPRPVTPNSIREIRVPSPQTRFARSASRHTKLDP